MSTEPNPHQLEAFRGADQSQPISMVNLLKYREHAQYDATAPESAEGLSGRDAYNRYAKVAMDKIKHNGGAIEFLSQSQQCFVGGDNDDWDQVVIVHYRSRADYLKGFDSPEYQDAIRHRIAGLHKRVIIQCGTNQARSHSSQILKEGP